MKSLILIMLLFFISACALDKHKTKKAEVCSQESVQYLKNPRNKFKQLINDPNLNLAIANTSGKMQTCYEEFRIRTGQDEFNTCLVVGVDELGQKEFHNFSSSEVKLDKEFKDCAERVTLDVPYSIYGKNYILVQSYQFYFQ